ncbi:MAG: hypothetical protein CMA05_00935 [Euryarchaeota archaeon]|nr:hypothetical protein [Euryarchaeota archaeon]
MAKVWKQILKQESEHQWLAIGVFFVFIILGAMMIKGTSFIPGIDLLDNEIGDDFRIMESTYIDENENYLLTYNQGDYELVWSENGDLKTVIGSDSNHDASSIDFITKLSNDSIIVPQESSSMLLIQDGNVFPFETNYGDDVFAIKHIVENQQHSNDNLLMLTTEADGKYGFRGLDSSGITSSPTPDNQNVEWQKVASISDELWIATGIYVPSPSIGEDSPATPSIRPVYATIIWSGGYTAPMISYLDSGGTGEVGEYHSIIHYNHDEIIIAGTHQTIRFNHVTNSAEKIDFASVAGISDDCNSAWLFNGMDSRSVLRISEDNYEIMKLPHKLPLTVESSGFDGETIYLHGTDNSGTSKVLTFDTTAVGSIESGRGFLNLSFIIISLIIFSVMAVNIYDRFRQ